MKLNHTISDKGGHVHVWYVCMFVCFCLYFYLYIGILYAKAFLGFSMDLNSSIQLEDADFIKLGEIFSISNLGAKIW